MHFMAMKKSRKFGDVVIFLFFLTDSAFTVFFKLGIWKGYSSSVEGIRKGWRKTEWHINEKRVGFSGRSIPV